MARKDFAIALLAVFCWTATVAFWLGWYGHQGSLPAAVNLVAEKYYELQGVKK